MIDFCKNWCEGIIVAVMISMIIEAILPDGNHKKYVKVVIGIYIIFTILNPFLGKINTKMEFSNLIDLPTVETSIVATEDIQQLYANGIEQNLKNAIEEEFGYVVEDIQIIYDENYENIENIKLELGESGVSKIEKVEIGKEGKSEENLKDYKEVKNYISENYDLGENRIIVN